MKQIRDTKSQRVEVLPLRIHGGSILTIFLNHSIRFTLTDVYQSRGIQGKETEKGNLFLYELWSIRDVPTVNAIPPKTST